MALEPDHDNFELCRRNLSPFGDRAQVVLGAVWSQRSRLILSQGIFGDGLDWAIQVRACEGKEDVATVDAWDVPSLLELAGEEHIDLLRVDIEKSELELFDDAPRRGFPK
jgi:hypothetical protein